MSWNDWDPDDTHYDTGQAPPQEQFDPLRHLGGLVPSYASWLAGLIKKCDESRRLHIQHVQQLLSGVTRAELDAAVEEIKRNDAFPKHWDMFPDEIMKRIRRLRSVWTKRKIETAVSSEVMQCRDCRDTGWVSVYYPEVVDAYRNGARLRRDGGELIEYAYAALCSCEHGRKQYHSGYKRFPRYQPGRDVLVVYDDLEKDIAFFDGTIGPPQLPAAASFQDVRRTLQQLAQVPRTAEALPRETEQEDW